MYLNCNILQRTATHCNTLQYTASHCNTLQHTATHLQHTATHCNTLQHTATHDNTLRHTATHCNTLQHTATHCNTLPHAATHCTTLQHTATHCNTLQHTTQHLQHTCNTPASHLQHTCNTYRCGTVTTTSRVCISLRLTGIFFFLGPFPFSPPPFFPPHDSRKIRLTILLRISRFSIYKSLLQNMFSFIGLFCKRDLLTSLLRIVKDVSLSAIGWLRLVGSLK